jgi:AraC-like DNA-binding protein
MLALETSSSDAASEALDRAPAINLISTFSGEFQNNRRCKQMEYRVQKIILLIRENPSKPLTLDKLAQAVNMSSSRLRHLFKGEVGKTPTQYLKDLRMERARKLLENTSFHVKQVMMDVGINDESHFLRDFKRAFGMTPKQCRVRRNMTLPGKPSDSGAMAIREMTE